MTEALEETKLLHEHLPMRLPIQSPRHLPMQSPRHFGNVPTALIAVCMLVLCVGCQSTAVRTSDFVDTNAISDDKPIAEARNDAFGEKTNTSQEKPALPDYVDPVARQQAVSEIRQKSASITGANPPNAHAVDNSDLEPKTPAEVEALKNELEQTGSTNTNRIEDAEIAAKKREMEELRRKAENHYNDALRRIEN